MENIKENPTLQDNGDINALIDEKINNDTDFQNSLSEMSQEDAEQAINDKKVELFKHEFSSLSEKLKKAEETAKNQKIRAEKAEKGYKKDHEPAEPAKQELSTVDIYALHGAKVHLDDIPEVESYAKFKGVSIAEALKSSVIKTMLSEREEMRKTAEATNTNRARKGPSTVSDEQKLAEYEAGKIPDDPAEAAKMRHLYQVEKSKRK